MHIISIILLLFVLCVPCDAHRRTREKQTKDDIEGTPEVTRYPGSVRSVAGRRGSAVRV